MNKFLCKLGHTIRILAVTAEIWRDDGRKEAMAFLKEKLWS